VQSAREAIGDSGAVAGDVQLLGDPAEEIVRYAEDDPGVMVIMGRRGLSRMKSLVLGSVSDKVSRHAKSPVTIIT
jgi:nucleotide-binding universal stress UspA family protein